MKYVLGAAIYSALSLAALAGGPLVPQPVVASSDRGMASLQQSYRASEIIGADVSNETGRKIGTVSDLLVSHREKVLYAIISMGGIFGIGEKLVSIPYERLIISGNRLTLSGETRESLDKRPAFHYLK